MKKILLTALLALSCALTFSQNLQLHYDFGKPEDGSKRNYLISTFEMFRPDTLGSTFIFVDFEYNSPDKPKGASSGYFEIAREFYIPWLKNSKPFKELTLHIEYNDGLFIQKVDSTTIGANINSAWLGGLGYPVHLGNFTINTMVLYKHIRGSSSPDFQFTLAWFQMLLKNRLTLSGFIDVWSQDDFYTNTNEKIWVFYAEPQIWFNATQKLSFGSEFKIGKNFFFGSKRTEVFPTIAAKYTF